MKSQILRSLFFVTVIVFEIFHANAQTNSNAAKSAADLVKEAKQKIESLTPTQVKEEMAKGNVTIIDLRETEELKLNGEIPGAVHAPRGMLEFYADPSMQYYKPEFVKGNRIILYCSSGGRSALAGETLKRMGYENIARLEGGFQAWKEAGMLIKK